MARRGGRSRNRRQARNFSPRTQRSDFHDPYDVYDDVGERRVAAHKVADQLRHDAETELAFTMARRGDDSLLLPYRPTRSINPPRPRTVAAGYDEETETLRVRFRDGTPWEYYGVSEQVWNEFRSTNSPGRFINRVLNNYDYGRGDF
ncbi:KTSC domain-containing protein [Actinomadura atramentaria]|uniref:KTSC domain-containing protein n=1 Tax=Actinomadura atramentaria TaxID=1990 RepID=UPI000399C7C4|nr:KTSC domain-containing protein [Actinomadura atramentaria]